MDEIREEEWRAEIDALRPTRHFNSANFTPEMDAKIMWARDKQPVVSWAALESYFKARGWPNSRSTLLNRYRELVALREKRGEF